MDNLWTGVVSVALGIIGLAAFASAVSNKAQTSQVVTSAGNALATNIMAAVSPVTGSTPTLASSSSF